jgi:superfamily II DNA or RNA helicase
VIVDEAHETNNSIIEYLKRKCRETYYRYGLTATPQTFENEYKKTCNMLGFIGPIIHEVSEDKTVTRVLPVVVKMAKWHCEKATGKNYQEVLRYDVLFSNSRNENLLKKAKLELFEGRNILVLLDEKKHGEYMLESAIKLKIKNPYFVHGKMDKKEIEKIKKELNDRKINFVIATNVFKTGTDIPNVDCVVLASSKKSHIDTVQKIGRGRRRTKHFNELVVIDSIDSFKLAKYNKYFKKYSELRMEIYQKKGWKILK